MVRQAAATDGEAATAPFPRRLWWTARAVGLHITLALALPLFAVAFIWQVDRVRQGNELSWAYVFEWPFFAAYAVYLWWKLLHDQEPGDPGAPRAGTAARAPSDAPDVQPSSEEDDELAAYNRYLAELNASGRRKHW